MAIDVRTFSFGLHFGLLLGKTTIICSKGQKKIPKATEQESTEAEKEHKEFKRKEKTTAEIKIKEKFPDKSQDETVVQSKSEKTERLSCCDSFGKCYCGCFAGWWVYMSP